MKDNFGDIETKDCELLCDDCYNEFMQWYKGVNEV